MFSRKGIYKSKQLSKTMKKVKKKFKIVENPKNDKQRGKDFRLFDFQSFDTVPEDNTEEKSFRIQMFGINEIGETCAILIDDFQPFFYVKIPDSWCESRTLAWFSDVKKKCKYSQKDCLSCKLEKHSQLYDFTANNEFKFAKCCFRNISAFYQFRREMSNKENGLMLPIYESKLPPLLRYFHIQNISPSGWIKLLEKKADIPEEKLTTCTYEYICSKKDIIPLPEKETRVPYKICSFDIEASSSHGDFPVPIKYYKRASTQIVDLIQSRCNKQKMDKNGISLLLKKSILAIFGYSKIDSIDIVYPKENLEKEILKEKIQKILEQPLGKFDEKTNENILKISEMFEEMSKNDEETGNFNEENSSSFQVQELSHFKKRSKKLINKDKKSNTIVEFLQDVSIAREDKIQILNTVLTDLLPPLQGDCVTFIGSTFLNYGEKEPYRNTCIVVGSCDTVAGAEIITVENETDCLLEWTQLIQDENPDIIIGYNIFGFDYQFMFQRAKELEIVDDFCSISRVYNEKSYKIDKESKEQVLEHTQNRLASGDYDLHYPVASGRLQIDLLFYFRRDYNLPSYKLDDVAGTIIRDDIKGIEKCGDKVFLYSKNLSGLHVNDFIHLEISSFTTDYYKNGKKYSVINIEKDIKVENNSNIQNGTYNVITINEPEFDLDFQKQTLKWGMSKDDVSPQDIFRLSKESSSSRAIVAKYCIQDCNLVHHLMNKVDVLTGYIEMSRICNVPISFLVFRGQGIKLTSYVAKVCREKKTLMPDLEKSQNDDGYEGAIVLPPKCEMYGENPVACVDYSSLYPSIAKGWNLSPNSKVWTKHYDLNGNLIKINDVVVTPKNFKMLDEQCSKYDNLDDYKYIDVTFDSFEIIQHYTSTGKLGRKDKIKCGTKLCRWAQFPDGKEGIIPCIIGDLLKARKDTRVQAENESDPFIANILDKRQLGYKVTANSLYGQMGSSVSTFFEKDVAASITAIGRMMITYAKRMVEEIYGNSLYTSKTGEVVRTKSSYVYGDTDSVFFTYNLEEADTGKPIRGKKALELTIELAQETARLCSLFLPPPMKLAYEKTLMSFILLSKKRYVGMLYEFNPNKGKLKFMGLPLKRRDSCDYLKDVYGGILTILMKEPDNIKKSIEFLNLSLQNLIDGKVSMDKLALTKSLRSYYKNPEQIAHKVLADRIGEREPGSQPKPGDRIKYVFIESKGEKKLLGERIETPQFIIDNKLKLDYHYYITNQLMNPLLQLFSLAVEKIYIFKKKEKKLQELHKKMDKMYEEVSGDLELYMKKREKYCSSEVKKELFDPILNELYNTQNGIKLLTQYYGFSKTL